MNNDKPNVKLKTIAMYINKKYNKALNELTFFSKNIYNISLYCYNIFSMFNINIYDDFINLLNNNTKNIHNKDDIHKYIKDNYDNLFISIFNKYYVLYNNNKIINENNNYLLYKCIKNDLNNVSLNSSNIDTYINKYQSDFKNICYFNDNNKFFVYDRNIYNIIKSIYDKQFNTVKNELLNKKPLSIKCVQLINDVKNNNYYFEKKKNREKYIIINGHKIELKSNQTIIKSIIFHGYISNYKNKLPSDVIGTIIDRFYQNIKSYFKLLEKKIPANKPTYIKTNNYNLYYTYRSFKHTNKNLRLTVGDYIASNYNKLVDNKLKKLSNRKYYNENNITKKKGKNYIKIDDNKYVHKNNIIDGYYLYFTIPKKIKCNKINYLQISKINNRYKLFIMYEDTKKINKKNEEHKSIDEKIDKSISIDTGIKNLMTIYDPIGKQHIIRGNELTSINSFYNKKINELKSINKLSKNKDTFNRLYLLLEERRNKINGKINLIIDTLIKKYKNKDIFIIGYNDNWKNKAKLGNSTKKFYQIPYNLILRKLKYKLEEEGKILIIKEESYTSKCDALTLESLTRKDIYNGSRIKRGLYISKTGKAINADLNGAINIMRKVYKLKEIKGKNIYCPETLHISMKNESIVENQLVVRKS